MSTRLLWLLLLVASSLVALLGYQLSQTRTLLVLAYESASRPQVGSWLPTVPLVALDERRVTLARPGTTQVLYFFTPDCPYCQATAPKIRDLYERLTREHGALEFLGVGGGDADALSADARKHGLGFPIVRLTPKLADLLGSRQVPLLVALAPDGQVRYSKVGVFVNKDDATSLMAALTRTDAGPTAE